MYLCNDCLSEIENENIDYSAILGLDICSECGSSDVDYFKD